jgi:hypothetical protein
MEEPGQKIPHDAIIEKRINANHIVDITEKR